MADSGHNRCKKCDDLIWIAHYDDHIANCPTTKTSTLSRTGLNRIIKACHRTARNKGWWSEYRPTPELLMLITTEAAEAMEAYRDGDTREVLVELDDVVIRAFDAAEGIIQRSPIDTEFVDFILEKMEKNRTRSHRHGGKRA